MGIRSGGWGWVGARGRGVGVGICHHAHHTIIGNTAAGINFTLNTNRYCEGGKYYTPCSSACGLENIKNLLSSLLGIEIKSAPLAWCMVSNKWIA